MNKELAQELRKNIRPAVLEALKRQQPGSDTKMLRAFAEVCTVKDLRETPLIDYLVLNQGSEYYNPDRRLLIDLAVYLLMRDPIFTDKQVLREAADLQWENGGWDSIISTAVDIMDILFADRPVAPSPLLEKPSPCGGGQVPSLK